MISSNVTEKPRPKKQNTNYYSSVVEFEVRDGNVPETSFLVQDCFEELPREYNGNCLESVVRWPLLLC